MCFASIELTGKMTSNFTMRKAGEVLENPPSGGQVRQGVASCREFPGFPSSPVCQLFTQIRDNNKERDQMFCKKGNYKKSKNLILKIPFQIYTLILNNNARKSGIYVYFFVHIDDTEIEKTSCRRSIHF